MALERLNLAVKFTENDFGILPLVAGGRWSSCKCVGTTCLRAASSSPDPPAMGVFWRLIWGMESLDRDLILVLQVFLRECMPVAAQTRSLQGWMHVRNPLLRVEW
jgi:hypothetical protein